MSGSEAVSLFIAIVYIVWSYLVCTRLGMLVKSNKKIASELREIKYSGQKIHKD